MYTRLIDNELWRVIITYANLIFVSCSCLFLINDKLRWISYSNL